MLSSETMKRKKKKRKKIKFAYYFLIIALFLFIIFSYSVVLRREKKINETSTFINETSTIFNKSKINQTRQTEGRMFQENITIKIPEGVKNIRSGRIKIV